MRLIPGPAFTFEAFKEILGAKDAISTLSCSSSADSEVWEHLRPSAHTAVLRAKHLHPGGFSTAAERVGSGSPQGCGQTRVPPQPKGRSSSCCLSYAGQGWRQPQPGAGDSTAPRPLPELETYISPYPFSHSKEVGLQEVALLLAWFCQLLPNLQPEADACFSLLSPEVPKSYTAAHRNTNMPQQQTWEEQVWKASVPFHLSADALLPTK